MKITITKAKDIDELQKFFSLPLSPDAKPDFTITEYLVSDDGEITTEQNKNMKNITPWSSEERRQALIGYDLDWYLVDYRDGSTAVCHQTSLSSIIDCVHPMEEFGITRIQQCWNGEDLGDE